MTSKRGDATDVPLTQAFEERLNVNAGGAKRLAGLKLARRLGRLPREHGRAAWEVSAALSVLGWRVSAEFLRAVPRAAKRLPADELRAWGEMGRRLAVGDVEGGLAFFAAGAGELIAVPPPARLAVMRACEQQITLSSSIALDTYRYAPQLAKTVTDAAFLREVFQTVTEIARRSAKHSAEFLAATPQVAQRWQSFRPEERELLAARAVTLAHAFAVRAGGLATDFWAALPKALARLTQAEALRLLQETESFLERGGGAALHFFVAGGAVMRAVPEVFADWCELLRAVSAHGNAALVAFVRSSPPVFHSLAKNGGREKVMAMALRVLNVTQEVARVDYEAALSCFRSSPTALRGVTLEQFEQWARDGLKLPAKETRARRSYYALETRRSHEALHQGDAVGLSLADVRNTLRLYIEGLTGHSVEIQPLNAVPTESRINDGRTVYLPQQVAEFGDESEDFRLYKVLAAHAAGQIEFGTHDTETDGLRDAYRSLSVFYALAREDDRDAFAAGGYIFDQADSEAALTPAEQAKLWASQEKSLPANGDYRYVLELFPDVSLAARIFGTLENGRIDRRLRHAYRGLRRDLDWSCTRLRATRPRIAELSASLVPFELLFQITLCGGALDDARQFYGQIVSELETVVTEYLAGAQASVADTLMATSRAYSLFESITDDSKQQEKTSQPEQDEAPQTEQADAQQNKRQRQSEQKQSEKVDARELFNAWSQPEQDAEPDDLDGAERWMQAETPEQALEEGEIAYSYDEWDRELSDHRTGWCRVVEKRVKDGDAAFVAQTKERYRGVISSIRHQFQLMKPENLRRIYNELDGDDYDLNAVIDYVIDRKTDGQQSERLYIKRLRRQRDVAVSFLLDQSSSTARTIGRNPLQPYTYPGRRIIEIEKEGLVLMSEALEAVGDLYAINGFTSEGRRNVKFYVVKDFHERYNATIHQRIGGISYQNNTRLGAAIRHAAARLAAQEARTRLLIVLSDGRPYDHDYGDARYAREDTREALRQAKTGGIIPFCITIDKDSEAELRDLYGEVGYTIIDDVLSLPERLPGIYRRLTS